MPEPKFTPGPWRWEVNLDSKRVELAGGTPRYDVDVLQFVRWGMSGAAPQFREDVDRMNIMHRADELAVPVKGREHHANWFRTIAHPDAHLIAAAPDLYEALSSVEWQIINTYPDICEMDESHDDGIMLSVKDMRAVLAALAKARGEASQ